jgi:hypothetical protein
VENEAYHIGRMLANETLKGYISTTRSVTVATGFAVGGGGPGWVYVLQLCGGFLIDQVGKLAEEWVKLWTEQEIAFPTRFRGTWFSPAARHLPPENFRAPFTCEEALPDVTPMPTMRFLSC